LVFAFLYAVTVLDLKAIVWGKQTTFRYRIRRLSMMA